MKYLALLSTVLLLSLSQSLLAQDSAVVFKIVEDMPVFPGCDESETNEQKKACTNAAIMKRVSENIKYPEQAKKNGIQGKVFVSFVVSNNGMVKDVMVLKGVEKTLDEAAVEAVKLLPQMIPGKQRGVAVSVSYTIPVQFKL